MVLYGAVRRNNINIRIYIRKSGCNAFHQEFVVHITEGSIDELIERADQLTIALNAANYHSSKQQHLEVAAATTTTKDNGDINLRNIADGICGYHRRFGSHARRCMHGCKHFTAKNAEGGRK